MSTDDTHKFTGSLEVSGSSKVIGSLNVTGTITEGGITHTDKFNYLRKSFVKKANTISIPATASFTAVTASAPSGMTATSENDFVFFINGQYMEHDALTIEQVASNFLLKVDTNSIGYGLEFDDEIIAHGKFNS